MTDPADGARREKVLLARANEARRSLEKLAQEHSQLDQKMASQTYAHAEKERILLLQLDAERKTSRRLEQELRQRENVLQQEITALRIDIEAQKNANQLRVQQNTYEISATNVARNLAHQARNAIRARVFAEQKENTHLRQELTELHQYLAQVHGSYLWRLSTPLRKFGIMGKSLIDAPLRSMSIRYDALLTRRMREQLNADYAHMADESEFVGQSLHPGHSAPSLDVEDFTTNIATSEETTIFSPTEASNYDVLAQYQGRKFIEATYLTLLRRLPDVNGLNFYLRRLQEGTTKLQVLHEIFSSEECKVAGVELPGLREAFAREEDPSVST